MGKKLSGYPIDWNHLPKVQGIISHCAKRNLLWTIPTGACCKAKPMSPGNKYKSKWRVEMNN